MAKGGAKKQLQENQARLALLKNLLIFSNVNSLPLQAFSLASLLAPIIKLFLRLQAWFAVGRLAVFWSSTTLSTYLVAAVMSALQLFCFTAITRMAGEALDFRRQPNKLIPPLAC